MRVIGGQARGRPLKAPSGRRLRPTADRVREALFNILQERVGESRFLDLFAGTGAVGIEALSRGAAAATFVELRREHAAILRGNLEACGLTDRARVMETDTLAALHQLSVAGDRFSLIFLDPPFEAADLRARTLQALGRSELPGPDCRIIAELPAREMIPEVPGLEVERQARYGEIGLSFYIRSSENGPDPP